MGYSQLKDFCIKLVMVIMLFGILAFCFGFLLSEGINNTNRTEALTKYYDDSTETIVIEAEEPMFEQTKTIDESVQELEPIVTQSEPVYIEPQVNSVSGIYQCTWLSDLSTVSGTYTINNDGTCVEYDSRNHGERGYGTWTDDGSTIYCTFNLEGRELPPWTVVCSKVDGGLLIGGKIFKKIS